MCAALFGPLVNTVLNFVLPIFGRCGPESAREVQGLGVFAPNPYPGARTFYSTAKNGSKVQVRCTNKLVVTTDDLDEFYWHANFPAGFIAGGPLPSPAPSAA